MPLHLSAALTALLAAVWLPTAFAQSAATPWGAASAAGSYRSAFDGYRRFSDQSVAPWKDTTDGVARIGGWKVDAQEAAREDAAAPAQPAASTASRPLSAASAPAATAPADHQGHHYQKEP